ncbi:glucan biosynthesis protein [Limibaculum sp. M0105]|uniref:Glucan biosynthesis protein n=2 Tax=Thermohalobaculum xanthum TaxID=2753746 RepID=A0A8J7SCK5_9RHOB|nr:glucan biosynthesis protein [Thermohalobaculum xanthum]
MIGGGLAATLGLTIAGATGAAHATAETLPVLGPPTDFSFDRLVELARRSASEPYRTPVIAVPEQIDLIDYDAHWQIRFRDDASLMPAGPSAPIQLFHPGRYFREPVRVHLVENGAAREIHYRRGFFSMPDDSPARDLPEDVGFAGFRVMRPGLAPDWVSFLGASYFRTDGPMGQYGLSARGIAVNTGLAMPEEFPRFSHFWIGPAVDPDDTVTAWALLDGPSVSGAYQFGLRRGGAGEPHVTTISARLFMRGTVERLGIAPLTSMYWFSERSRILADEWRPEIHDSDGLAIETGAGERIWRPLGNPNVVRTSSFFDENPKGFGLIQRDRAFENYQDDGVFYNRRPSAWIEPLGPWGKGAVQLIEIPTVDETFDNIVAYWTPEEQPAPGEMLAFDYRIHWDERDPPSTVARVFSTRQGQGGAPGQDIPEGIDKMVIDFQGQALKGLTVDSGVEPVIEAVGGRILGPIGCRPVVGTDRWRLSFDFSADGPEPVQLRAYLRRGDAALTETWVALATTDRKG